MSHRIEYQGFVIEPSTQLRTDPEGWSLEVRITPAGRRTGTRRCRGFGRYSTEEIALARGLELGRRIVDGRARRRGKPTR